MILSGTLTVILNGVLSELAGFCLRMCLKAYPTALKMSNASRIRSGAVLPQGHRPAAL